AKLRRPGPSLPAQDDNQVPELCFPLLLIKSVRLCCHSERSRGISGWKRRSCSSGETSLDMTKLGKLALILFCAITSGLAQSPQTAPTPSIVYAVHDPGSIIDYKTNPRVVHEMVNRLVLAATG